MWPALQVQGFLDRFVPLLEQMYLSVKDLPLPLARVSQVSGAVNPVTPDSPNTCRPGATSSPSRALFPVPAGSILCSG